jgi:hypothetical protein
MASETLRNNLIRLASTLPKGSSDRKQLLQMVAKFPADSIGETVSGPTGIPGSDASKPWAKGEFTQQENMELDKKQESGLVGDGKADDGPMKVASADRPLFNSLVRLAQANKEARGPILGMLREAGLIACDDDDMAAKKKEAGCEKLPEGGMRDNCEKKKGEKGDDDKDEKDDDKDEKDDDKGDDKGDKKASDARLRSALIRLASENPAFRAKLLPILAGN